MKRITLLLLLFPLALISQAQIPTGYYEDADGLSKADLKSALHDIIGYASVLDYGSGYGRTWSGFYQTDRMANNQVRDRYSYETFYFSSSASASSASAVSGMNIEHSFPKSWWGGSKNQAYEDLYNLMPCESSINSSKSNYAMGVVSNVKTTNGCTKVGTGTTYSGRSISLWEPADEWKGDFARGYFYMVTAYSNLTWQGSSALSMLENDQWPTLQQWAYTLLLEWCRQDPVDEIEKARNEAVYKIQGNRNPFVDFPNLAEYIWGDSISYAFSVDGSSTGPITPDNPDEEEILLAESFSSGLGDFTCVHYDGSASDMWVYNSQFTCAVANAYSKGKSGDDWLISPEIDMTEYETAILTFDHATGYNSTYPASDKFSVLVSIDYAGVPEEADWENLEPSWPVAGSKSFTSFETSGDIDLSGFKGQKIYIAFRYKADEDQCWAWEVKNFSISGVKSEIEDGVDDNFMSPVFAEQAVFTIGGVYVGNELPRQSGIYVVKKGDKVFKKLVP